MAQTQGEYGAAGTRNNKGLKATPAITAPKNQPHQDFGKIGFGVTARSAIPSGLGGAPHAAARAPFMGGGGSFGGGGGVGSNASGHISAAAPAAPAGPPDLNAFAAKDSAYQQQVSALKKAFADYMAQQGTAKTQYQTSYGADLNSLKDNRTNSLGDLENDYASRGLLQSGLYADSMSDLNKEFDTKQSALDQARAAFLAQQSGDLTNFQSEQQLTQQKALQEAAARRAAQYSL